MDIKATIYRKINNIMEGVRIKDLIEEKIEDAIENYDFEDSIITAIELIDIDEHIADILDEQVVEAINDYFDEEFDISDYIE